MIADGAALQNILKPVEQFPVAGECSNLKTFYNIKRRVLVGEKKRSCQIFPGYGEHRFCQ